MEIVVKGRSLWMCWVLQCLVGKRDESRLIWMLMLPELRISLIFGDCGDRKCTGATITLKLIKVWPVSIILVQLPDRESPPGQQQRSVNLPSHPHLGTDPET